MRNKCITLLVWFSLAACGGGGGGGGSSNNSSNTTSSGSGTAQPISTQSTSPGPLIDPATSQIKILGLISPGVSSDTSEAQLRLTHLVNTANDILTHSGTSISLSLIHNQRVDYPDAAPAERALEELTQRSHAAFTTVDSLRREHAADIVILLRPYANDGVCGYAWMGGAGTDGDMTGFAQFAYAVVASNCSDYVLAHEVGHLLGLSHSRREADAEGTFDYARGYGVDDSFTTVMASPAEFNATQLPRFSSPSLQCNGQPCGVTATSADAADAVQAIQITGPQVADYLPDAG